MTKIFVYGTLKRGHGNHRLLENSEFIGEYKTDWPLFSMSSYGGFPAVCWLNDDLGNIGHVSGELYDIDDKTLQTLDFLEGHPDFYARQFVSVNGEDVYMYLIPEDEMPSSSQDVSFENNTYTWR